MSLELKNLHWLDWAVFAATLLISIGILNYLKFFKDTHFMSTVKDLVM